MSPGDIWEESAPGRGNSNCKGLEAGVCLVYGEIARKSVAEPGVVRARGR